MGIPSPGSTDRTLSRKPWRPRFGLFSLLLATTLLAVGAALLGHLVREGSGSVTTGVFVILAAAAPLALMAAASLLQFLSAPQRRDPPD